MSCTAATQVTRMDIGALYLAKHVFFCLAEEYCIFLDLRKDKYLCASRDNMLALGPLLDGWDSTFSTADAAPTDEVRQFAALLLEAGILTSRREDGRPARPTDVYPSRAQLKQMEYDLTVRPSVADWIRFLWAAAAAHLSLKRGQLETTVQAVAKKKSCDACVTEAGRARRMRAQVSKFHKLRNVFPRRYLCLFDSLALMRFLAMSGVSAEWIFAVRSNPFEAHCWVQSGSLVLNDVIDEVRAYTPIMRV
jgi:hypothetical protein